MKCFHLSQYKFYAPNCKELKFFLISDIHFSPKVTATTLDALVHQAQTQQPNYILIAGDLVDSLDNISSATDLKRLTAWLEQLGKIAPVLIALGNHDFYRANPQYRNVFSRHRHWYAEDNPTYVQTLNNTPNIHLLDNQAYEDHAVYIFGFTQSPEYFQFDRDEKSTTLFKPGGEDRNIMLSDIDALDQKLITKLPKHKAKIAIIHSPVYLTDSEVGSRFNEFDFIVSGHMHNGVVPPVLNEAWPSDRGLIAPGKKFFPRGSRAHIKTVNDRLLTLGAVSTIQNSAKPLTFLNNVYPVSVATLELSHRETLARKPDVRRKYVRF